MKALPHRYTAGASARRTGDVALSTAGLQRLHTASPPEFDGPGDRWSPETLLVAAIADCFVLTFRAIADASRFRWLAVACTVTGTLDRVDGSLQFTAFQAGAQLQVPAGTNVELARRLLDKAERLCLVSNSLKARCELDAEITEANHDSSHAAASSAA